MTALVRSSRIGRQLGLASAALMRIVRAIAGELRRLNRARLDSATLARLAPRERRKAVKAALAAHHRKSSRCC